MSLATFLHVARSSALPARFRKGGTEFIVDRSMPEFIGYEFIDDHTVRIHPSAVEMMYRHLETETPRSE